MTQDSTPKLDPRIRRTRKLIEDAFIDLYRTKPMKHITVGEITAAAGINRATFYKHYQDKFALFDAIVQQAFEAHLSHHVQPDAPLDEETFHSLVYGTLLFIQQWRAGRSLIAEETEQIIETRVQHTVFDRIMHWIEPNYLKGPCEAGTDVAATAVSWAVFGVAIQLSKQKEALPVDAVASELVKMLAGGLWTTLVGYYAKAQSSTADA